MVFTFSYLLGAKSSPEFDRWLEWEATELSVCNTLRFLFIKEVFYHILYKIV